MNRQTLITNKLKATLTPIYLDLVNESGMHGRPDSAESHFKVLIVSEKFNGKSLLEQQRLVYDSLKEEIREIHAFSIKTMTPSQWEHSNHKATLTSPACRGGSKVL